MTGVAVAVEIGVKAESFAAGGSGRVRVIAEECWLQKRDERRARAETVSESDQWPSELCRSKQSPQKAVRQSGQ